MRQEALAQLPSPRACGKAVCGFRRKRLVILLLRVETFCHKKEASAAVGGVERDSGARDRKGIDTRRARV